MNRYRIEATWGEDADGAPLVNLEFARHDPDREAWIVLGAEKVTDPVAMTPKRTRAAALNWLAEEAGMQLRDSFEMHYWQRAGRDALERIEAAVQP